MNPIDEMALESSLERFLERNEGFKIYTHSTKTRISILGILLSYITIFVFFARFIRSRLEGLDKTPTAFLSADPEVMRWLFLGLSIVGLLIAVGVMAYFVWAVLDIWGLQVCVNSLEIRVQNTITGANFKNWTGVGSLLMEDITALKGARSATYVIGSKTKLRFSPVDQVDKLVLEIMQNAKNIEVEG